MIFHQLNVLPTEETLDYLSAVMSGAPLDLDLQAYKLEVITTLDPVIACPENIYTAKALHVKVWYDAYLERSSLILSLLSSDLQKRCMQLNELGVVREFRDYYNPHLTLRPDMPPLSRHYRTFVVQTADALVGGQDLEFTGEYVTQVDLLAPPDNEYNLAMIAERGNRRDID